MKQTCKWTADKHNTSVYATECGHEFLPHATTPEDSDFIYCPGCGCLITHESIEYDKSNDPLLRLAHEMLREPQYAELNVCVTCGASGGHWNHDPKRQHRRVLGLACDTPFLSIWLQCDECHDHKSHAEQFDHEGIPNNKYNTIQILRKRIAFQRDFLQRIIARPALYNVCRGYH